MDVRDKVIVVTGAASGIGRALVERFVRDGARHVVVADLDATGATAVADRLGSVTSAVRVDVTDGAAIARVVDETETSRGPIDLWCSNAGVLPIDPDPDNAASAPDAAWSLAWGVNVMAHVYAARALLPRMIARGGGYFLHTVSAAGLLSQIGSAPYSTTKHAAIGFAESLAITHRDHGIRVTVVCPQAVDTAMIVGKSMNGADVDGVATAEHVADCAVDGIARETFLVLPHPSVATYAAKKTESYDRWIGGMVKFRRGMRSRPG
jgi:NAD(P)-dependent dehydrogenase (short-subunit alcohol dehydrogenase family)